MAFEGELAVRREEDGAPLPPKHYSRARPLAAGETRTDRSGALQRLRPMCGGLSLRGHSNGPSQRWHAISDAS